MNYFIATKEQYIAICTAWKKFVNDSVNDSRTTVDSTHMMLYNILRSKPFDHGFTCVTNQIKLDNGCHKWECIREAADRLKSASIYRFGLAKLLKPFGEIINKEVIDRAWAAIKDDERLK